MIITYGKVGRALPLTQDKWGVVGGDQEAPRLLDTLARRHPDDTFVIVSTCRDDPQACGYTPNVVNSWTPERLAWYRDAIRPYSEVLHAITKKELGKNDPRVLPAIRSIEGVLDQLLLPFADKMEGSVQWIGQHGTANSVLPAVTDRSGVPGYTRPYENFTYYCGGIFRMINAWRDPNPWEREEVWLIADARNHLKARDIKWPLRHPVVGQFDFIKDLHHERFGHPLPPNSWNAPLPKNIHAKWKSDHTWLSPVRYEYSGLEVCSILPHYVGHHYDPNNYGSRRHFGIFINEAGFHAGQGSGQEASGRLQRAPIVAQWVLPLQPAFVHGKWTSASQKKLGIEITPAPFADFYPLMASVKSTFTTPSSGSGWATTKPWEAFASGTVCFKHPEYDTQNHIYGRFTKEQREWLCPPTPADLAARVQYLDSDFTTWHWLVHAQYQLYMEMCQEKPWIKMIEKRLYGHH